MRERGAKEGWNGKRGREKKKCKKEIEKVKTYTNLVTGEKGQPCYALCTDNHCMDPRNEADRLECVLYSILGF